jgi:CSLREA domain-containing protein
MRVRTRGKALTKWAIVATLVATAAALTACTPIQIFLVNSTIDAVDATPGDGVCETATPGQCTLRAAIQEANAAAGPITIELQSSATYPLTIGGAGEDLGATGDLDVVGTVYLIGNGATIDAEGNDRVIDHHSGLMTITGLTVTGGDMSDGSGIRNNGNLLITDSTITMNTAVAGTSVGASILHIDGRLDIARSAITGLRSILPEVGGVVQLGGTLNIADSVLSGNIGMEAGYELNQLGGQATVVNSSLRGSSELVDVPVCKPFGCFTIQVAFTSRPVQAEGSVTLLRSTLGAEVFGADFIVVGTGTVEAAASLLYGSCAMPIDSNGYNAFRSGSTCANAADPTDLILATAPLETAEVPNVGEPVLDAIPLDTLQLCDSEWAHDRRQLPRPQGTGCDIGAIERQPDDPSA